MLEPPTFKAISTAILVITPNQNKAEPANHHINIYICMLRKIIEIVVCYRNSYFLEQCLPPKVLESVVAEVCGTASTSTLLLFVLDDVDFFALSVSEATIP